MQKTKAKELLQLHSFTHSDVDHPKMERGFLGMLRPFQGELYEDNFHEIMSCIKCLSEDLQKEDIDRDVISSLWGICHLTQVWAIYPDGMLQSNNLISEKQIQTLSEWVDSISYATMCLLGGSGEEEALEPYRNYIETREKSNK